jgi:RHS repeat-associated protein
LARSRHATTSPYGINGTSYYHADGNGNVTYLASATGGPDGAYRYDPFGRWLAQTGSYAGANGMRFSSKPWIAHNGSNTEGLYYYGYRFYDPLTQRWLNRDPLGEPGFTLLQRPRAKGHSGHNLYAFVGNNPITRLDPLGLWYDSISGYLRSCAELYPYDKKMFCNCMCVPTTVPDTEQECRKKCEECADLASSIGKGKRDPQAMCLCTCIQANKWAKANGLPTVDCGKICKKVKCKEKEPEVP